MSRAARAGLLALAVVIVVVAFIVLQQSDEDEDTTAGTPTPTATLPPADTPGAEETEAPTATPTPRPTVDPGPVLTGEDVERLEVDKGDVVRFRVRSPQDDHVHVHGYDIMRDVKANETTRIFFRATIDGIFEIELEDAQVPIAELRVDP
jgi:hypothetical protein